MRSPTLSSGADELGVAVAGGGTSLGGLMSASAAEAAESAASAAASSVLATSSFGGGSGGLGGATTPLKGSASSASIGAPTVALSPGSRAFCGVPAKPSTNPPIAQAKISAATTCKVR